VFDGVRFVSKAVMIAIGINEEGYREILDMRPFKILCQHAAVPKIVS
jgi:hypothetical protein